MYKGDGFVSIAYKAQGVSGGAGSRDKGEKVGVGT